MSALETEVREYSSPLRKLTRFFCKSRNRWKQKCLDAKHGNKLLRNQVRAVERSREQWKRKVEEQERRIEELEAELQKIGAAC
jgi:hypothetical protein